MIKIEGIDQLSQALKKALVDHKPEAVRKSLMRAGKVIVDEAKGRAPVSDKAHTFTTASGNKVTIQPGNLKKSIQILPKWSKDPSGIYVGPKIKRRNADKGGVNGWYGHFVEYGVARHNLGYKGKYVTGKGADHPGYRAKPYMRPALDSKGKQAVEIAMVDIEKMIMK